jgi:predicted glycoside hydrolase/deacetylase ChbG (UPF0249 family)
MRVILNADDFGSTERHTRLILDLLQTGKIGSTTFLVNLPYSETAAKLIQQHAPQLVERVGLHFNLTEGKPLNPALLNTPFVNAAGEFQDFRGRVGQFQQLRHWRKLKQELDLQIQLFQGLMGRYPSHIDSHGHTHCTWVMLLALLFSKEAGKVRAIRLTRQYDHEPILQKGLKNRIRRMAKSALNFAFRLRFKTTEYFTDIRNLDESWLSTENLQFLNAKFKTIEVMCHPYYFDESEYDFLSLEPNLFAQRPEVQMISYRNL